MPMEVHVDVDNFKVYKDLLIGAQIPEFDVYKEAFSRSIEFFSKNSISAIYFVVGEDLINSKHAKAQLQEARLLGHEIANHTMTHPAQFHMLSIAERNEEVERCHTQILETLDVVCSSYRAPGYSFKISDQEKLSELNYLHNYSKVSSLYTAALNLTFKWQFSNSKKFPSIIENIKTTYRKRMERKIFDSPTSIAKAMRTCNISTVWFKAFLLSARFVPLVKAQSHSPLLFHIIDFLDYCDKDCKVPALRIPLDERMLIMQRQLDRLL